MPLYKFCDWIDTSKIQLKYLAKNPSPAIMHYFDKRPQDRLRLFRIINKNNLIIDKQMIDMFLTDDWEELSAMPELITVLENHSHKINWLFLCENPGACHLIKKVIEEEGVDSDKLNWAQICCNKSAAAIDILTKHADKIRCEYLSSNPFAFELLKQNQEKIDWENFSYVENEHFIEFMEKNIDKIYWKSVSCNSHPRAIALLKKYPQKINWNNLHFNENEEAIKMLEENPTKIVIEYLCYNKNPRAIALLEKNPQFKRLLLNDTPSFNVSYCWDELSKNPAAIDLLRRHPDKIKWHCFSENPAIFTYNYTAMRASRAALHEEFIAWWWHPRRVAALLGDAEGGIDILDEM